MPDPDILAACADTENPRTPVFVQKRRRFLVYREMALREKAVCLQAGHKEKPKRTSSAPLRQNTEGSCSGSKEPMRGTALKLLRP